ncbi:hypothetical protein BUPH_08414 (plasmid) [Paraburkholderia phenoliruptrix BR3459a]|uniref:Uncharacterized protein n=1 Tax=Paraburkholderia phenoliruptrix BR3459a TaxID=1229205 RepID=K0DWH5_9BURK|nr:hypothetical protein BUPH_08414 [Paraburkholderia phenoliruptrix BR3459a]
MLPALDCLWIALVSALQRLLRRQVQTRQHRADRGQAPRDTEFTLYQFAYEITRPKPEVKAILHWVLAIDPAQRLLLLCGSELARAACCLRRPQRTHTSSSPPGLRSQLVRPRCIPNDGETASGCSPSFIRSSASMRISSRTLCARLLPSRFTVRGSIE